MFSRRAFRWFLLGVVVCLLGLGAQAQSPIGELIGSDASIKGTLRPAGGDPWVMSGASVAAGETTASLKLARGGELRICRRSSVSVTASKTGQEIMLGLSSGTIEMHYRLAAGADTVMTPDFQIQLTGPGVFHYAISADERGNTCIQALPNNTGSITISELMGDGFYKLKPQEQLFFRAGRVGASAEVIGSCGCPAPPPVLRAQTRTPGSATGTESRGISAPVPVLPGTRQQPVTAPPPQINPRDVHVEVEAPFVYRADAPRVPPPEAPRNIARIHLASLPPLELTSPLPPRMRAANGDAANQTVADAKNKKKKRGFWGFLHSVFGG